MLPALAIEVFSHPVLGSSERDEDLSEGNEGAYRIPDPCIVCGEGAFASRDETCLSC